MLRRWRARGDRDWRSTPRTLKTAGFRVAVLHGRQLWLATAVAFLVLVIPVLTWLVLSIGARGRASNCDVIENVFLHDHAASAHGLERAYTQPDSTPAEVAVIVAAGEAYRKGLDSDLRAYMEGCH